MAKGFLVLADGTVFPGELFGAPPGAVGELVFNTGMNGYIETLTDPSYYGQIVMQTFPLIGNYGIIDEDFEGGCFLKGYVVREACGTPVNFRSRSTLDDLLRARGVPGLCGVDTRAVTRHIRERGVMNAMLCAGPPEDLSGIRAYAVRDAVRSVSARETAVYPAAGEKRFRVTLIDYGVKRNIIRELVKRGCEVTSVPSDTPAARILAGRPDGVMLSNGPGDPAENTDCVAAVRGLLGRVPLFGVCLGHQLMALAAGGRTEKLHFGHRGGNQPVTDLRSRRTYITSQNHGYTVIPESLPFGEMRWINANDGTCEGVDYPGLGAFSVQFHPEACPGPEDTVSLFDRFIRMMGGDLDAAG